MPTIITLTVTVHDSIPEAAEALHVLPATLPQAIAEELQSALDWETGLHASVEVASVTELPEVATATIVVS
jgi:hypothetical protein